MAGLAHAVQAPPSRRHSNVEPGSVEEKPKLAAVSVVGDDGAEEIGVFGAVVSAGTVTVQLAVAAELSVLPAASVARTAKAWSPTATSEYALGLVHATQAPPSRRHSNVEPDSVEEKPKLAAVSVVGDDGAEEIAVSGAVVSAGGGGTVPLPYSKAPASGAPPAGRALPSWSVAGKSVVLAASIATEPAFRRQSWPAGSA